MKLNNKDIELLIHTKCKCFYNEQKHRFEHLKGNIKNINDKGMFSFIDDTLSALYVFNYYKDKKLNPVMLWDLAEPNAYVIATNQNWEQYIK